MVKQQMDTSLMSFILQCDVKFKAFALNHIVPLETGVRAERHFFMHVCNSNHGYKPEHNADKGMASELWQTNMFHT